MKDAPVDSPDVIIRERRAGGFVFTVGVSAEQIICHTFEEALALAGRAADAGAVDLWYADDRQPPVRVQQRLLARVWAEYCELPGLGLTALQAQRLWGVDTATCATLLDILVRAQLLMRGIDGRYRRVADTAAAKMAKAAPRQPALATAGDHRRRHA